MFDDVREDASVLLDLKDPPANEVSRRKPVM